ncbi:hypothetical protein CI111_02760 [Fusobacterium animalis]|uniref:Uncharacterized protein n=1 Tax=Fusobacterium animalis TaxID=76859 RepID=A0A2G9FM62_9FUSO|nr:hypothetical protein [Fusobacterium animalis]PIM93073.1 hypothetical protein CI114_02640 [Fusobacterium animalis]PIM94247.1 hypothetical protein CI111_02760 [Fusobacterium animalis]
MFLNEKQAQYLLKHLEVSQENSFAYKFHQNGDITQKEIEDLLHFDKSLKHLYGEEYGIINTEELLILKNNKK